MTVVVSALTLALLANAVIAFGVAFYWQARVIVTVIWGSDWNDSHVPWKALGKQDSPDNSWGHFIAGDIFPELRRKWLKAVAYVALSFLTLISVVGVLQLVAPEYLP